MFFFNYKYYSNVFNIQFVRFDFLSVLNNEVKKIQNLFLLLCYTKFLLIGFTSNLYNCHNMFCILFIT